MIRRLSCGAFFCAPQGEPYTASMSTDRRRAPQERRQTDGVPAVFAVKKAIAGPDGAPTIASSSVRPRTSPRPDDDQAALRQRGPAAHRGGVVVLASRIRRADSARGLVVSDASTGPFRGPGCGPRARAPSRASIAGYCRREPQSRSCDRRVANASSSSVRRLKETRRTGATDQAGARYPRPNPPRGRAGEGFAPDQHRSFTPVACGSPLTSNGPGAARE